jgi:hypothetical protein
MTGRRERRRKQLLDDLKEKRGYWILMEEALGRTLWRTRFVRGYGPVVRHTIEWMNEWMNEWIGSDLLGGQFHSTFPTKRFMYFQFSLDCCTSSRVIFIFNMCTVTLPSYRPQLMKFLTVHPVATLGGRQNLLIMPSFCTYRAKRRIIKYSLKTVKHHITRIK